VEKGGVWLYRKKEKKEKVKVMEISKKVDVNKG